MSRPTSKAELLEKAREGYEALQVEISKLAPATMVEPGTVGEWSVKDVLAHLLAWQQMAVGWYRAGKRGETPVTPSEKYNWQQIPALNQEIYETYRDHPLDAVCQTLDASHHETLALIETMTNDELFSPKVYAWTRTTTLGSYFTSVTSSHYEWARKEIRKGLKAKRESV